MSYSWTSNAIRDIRDAAMEELHTWLVDNSVLILHDNIRLVFKVQTQHVNNQTHGDNGTASTVRRAAFAQESPPIRILSVKTLMDSLCAARLHDSSVHNIITILLDSPEFSEYRHQKHPDLAPPPPIHALPTGPAHRTRQWMLGVVPIEEATYSGNIQVVEEILRQTGLDKDDAKVKLAIGNAAIPWGGDQLTESRLKIAKWFRARDINGFERMDWLLTFFGWFHVVMVLANAVYGSHRGDSKGFG
ncbi:hypothetical protein BOTBODRAFT_79169, partial [Botryobasidium botryosum FD-172 SS1]